LGVAALLEASAFAFTVVKLAGAIYLVYLGLRTLISLRRGAQTQPNHLANADVLSGTQRAPLQQGLGSNLLNPKIAVFFTSLIPQFVTDGPAAAAQSTELAAIFVLLGLAWLTAFAIFAGAAARLLRAPRVKRFLDAITGTVLIGFGFRLAAETR
jgi:threonine/homoserine/homoserine lactone efflux protein